MGGGGKGMGGFGKAFGSKAKNSMSNRKSSSAALATANPTSNLSHMKSKHTKKS